MVSELNEINNICAINVIQHLEADINEAKDNLTVTKLSQTVQANHGHTENFPLEIGDHVLLSTLN